MGDFNPTVLIGVCYQPFYRQMYIPQELETLEG